MKLLFVSITNRCDRACGYCPVATWRNNPAFPDSLTLDRCKEVIEDFKPTHAEVTGGEPTMSPMLDGLLDLLEAKGIYYMVKSNGLKRCRQQITAWHDGLGSPPKNYDKILVLKTGEWEEKLRWCKERNIPYGLIGFNSPPLVPQNRLIEQRFLCPDGKLKMCHESEKVENPALNCINCKAVSDFLAFADKGIYAYAEAV